MTDIFSFTDIRFYLLILYFFPVLFLALYVPGNLLVHRLKLAFFESTVLSCIVGLVLWAFQAVIFGYAGLRWLSFLYIALSLVFWLRGKRFSRIKLSYKNFDFILLLTVIVGVVVQLLTVWFIGYGTAQGVAFCCFWPDSFYHLGLITELTSTFPPVEPGMQGVAVHNYHFLANLVIADLVRVFHLPIIHVQYQFMPIFISFLLAGATISVGNLLKISKNFTRFLVFFLFFSGDIIFLLLFILGKGLVFDTTVSENATTLWFSPPRTYAMVILFAIFAFVLVWIKKPGKLLSVLIGLLVGSLIGFKIYLGFFAIIGLCSIALWYFLKKDMRGLVPLCVAGCVTLALYLPVNTQAGGLFFSGLWRIDDFAVRPAFGLINFTLAKQVYVEHHNVLRVALIELLFFSLYMFSLCGMFLVGLVQSRTSLQKFPMPLHLFLLSGGFVCFIIGMFFLQNTGGANTQQFLFSIYIVGAFYAALAVSYWSDRMKKPVAVLFITLILILSGARVIYDTYMNMRDLVSRDGYFDISAQEIEGLRYLKNTIPDTAVIAVDNERAVTDECYVLTIFSERNFYLCGSGILADHGIMPEHRMKALDLITKSNDPKRIAEVIRDEKIEYFYVPAQYLFGTTQTRDFLDLVYNNGTVYVLKVNPQKLQKKLNE